MKYLTGLLIGGAMGAAALLAAELYDPSVYRMAQKRSKCIARMCKKKMRMLNMF